MFWTFERDIDYRLFHLQRLPYEPTASADLVPWFQHFSHTIHLNYILFVCASYWARLTTSSVENQARLLIFPQHDQTVGLDPFGRTGCSTVFGFLKTALEEFGGEVAEEIAGGAEGIEGGDRFAGEAGGLFFGGGEAEEGGIGGLAGGDVLAGAFAKDLAGLGAVEDVVDDLEGEAEIPAELAELIEACRGGVGGHGAEAQGGDDHGGSFSSVDKAEAFAGLSFEGLAFGFHIGDLPGDEKTAAGGGGEFAHKMGCGVARGGTLAGENSEGFGEEGVTGEHGERFAVDDMAGGAPAP